MRLFVRFFPLYLVIFIGFFGYSMTLPIFTEMVMNGSPSLTPGARTSLLGFLLTLYPLGQFFGSPILGALSDRYGRKRLLLCSLLLSSCFYIGIALALTLNLLPLLLITLFLAGLSEGNIALAQSSISDSASGEERRSAFGLVYAVACLAYVAGPLVSGLLSSSTLVSWFSYDTPFWFVVLFLLISLLWVARRMADDSNNRETPTAPLFQAFTSLGTLVTEAKLRPYYLINFLIHMAIYGFFRAFPMYAVDRFDTGMVELSLLIAYISVPLFIANTLVVPWIPKRWNSLLLAATTAFLMALSLILVPLPKEANSFWITLFPVTFFLAICQTEIASVISSRASPEEVGRVMGNNQSLQVGAEALSASLAGFVAAIAISTPFYLFAAMGAAGGLLLLRLRRN